MRTERERKKKLIVAFHFQFANQTAWKCDTCRAQRLESRRRCGYIPQTSRGPERIVWMRGSARVTECPKSLISPDSIAWLESYQARRTFGFGDIMHLPARAVDAFSILEIELAAEKRDATK